MNKITIPYNFNPRHYQLDLLSAVDSGYKRAIVVWHRRSGKDKTLINLITKKALQRRGIYYYFYPTYKQGKKALWDNIDKDGFKFMDHIPDVVRASTNNTDMKITLVNGSIIQIIGTDDYDSVRGTNPVGCVFSEFAYQDPGAWDVVRPILRENGGWAVFNSTPFGKNHFYKMLTMAQANDKWFSQVVTVKDSRDNNGIRFVPDEAIQEELDAGMPEELVEQEYFCSFTANSEGFYYLKYLNTAEEEGRISNVPYDPATTVDTWWDIGVHDSTAIWFTQTVGKEIHVIDYYEDKNMGLEEYIHELHNRRYNYGVHHFPHDIQVREFGSGRSRLELAEELLGSSNVDTVMKLSIEDGIQASRLILSRCWFDEKKCEKGLNALYNYHREYDDKLKEYKNKPAHGWESHAADAFRYLAVGYTEDRRASRLRNNSRLRSFGNKGMTSWKLA